MPVILSVLIATAVSWAQIPAQASDENCPFQIESQGQLQVQRMRYGPDHICVVFVSPLKRGPTWRSFGFFENGLFLIFFNFGAGEASQDTGARSYFRFPRNSVPTFRFEGQTLTVREASSRFYKFNTETGALKEIEGADFKMAKSVTRENQGGFEITRSDGLLLENGFAFGEVPYASPDRVSVFHFDGDRTCAPPNYELFDYIYQRKPDGSRFLDQVIFRFSDAELDEFLNIHCPAAYR